MIFIRFNGEWRDYGTNKPVPVAPLQVSERNDSQIPLIVAEEGYKEYSAQYGKSQSLERLNERGGFSATELCTLLYERIKRLESGK